MRINHVRHALKAGKLQLGLGFGQLRSPEVARLKTVLSTMTTAPPAQVADKGTVKDAQVVPASVPSGK